MQARAHAAWVLFSAAAIANAQAPAAPVNNPGQVAVPATIEPGKDGNATAQPARQRTNARPARFSPPPTDIRIQEQGVKMPKCAAESREGEECKK